MNLLPVAVTHARHELRGEGERVYKWFGPTSDTS